MSASAPVARVERLAFVPAHEGPVWVAEEEALYLTTLAGEIARLSPPDGTFAVVVADANANAANGMALAPDGRLIVCEQGGPERDAAISLVDPRSGAREVLVDGYTGRPLNSPNDVVVAGDGAVWFTDPSYGWLQGFRPRPALPDAVYRHDPATGNTAVAADGFDKPNGLAFSPDGSVLYVNDSGINQEPGSLHWNRPHQVEAFDVDDDGRLGGRRLVCVVPDGQPDGMKVDPAGRVLVSEPAGIGIWSADGERLGGVPLPGAVNFCWAGPGRLLVCADTAVWAVELEDSP